MRDLRVIKPDKNRVVVKENRLINARYDLTLQEQRLVLWLISEIKPTDKGFSTFRMNIKEIAAFIGLEGSKNIYERMYSVTRRLLTRVIEIEKENGYLFQSNWISSADYGPGHVDISLDPRLLDFLIAVSKNFTKYELKNAITMRSTHAIRMYELLKQYEKIGSRVLTVEQIRAACHIKDTQYAFVKDLRLYVVDIAVREINERSDIFVSWEPVKSGRKITGFSFSIQKNPNAEAPDPIRDDPTFARIYARLLRHGIKPEEAREFVLAYTQDDPDRLEYACSELERRTKGGDKIANPAGWLVQAIKDDYRPQQTLFGKIEKEKRDQEKVVLARIEEIEGIIKAVESDFGNNLRRTISGYMAELDREERLDIEEAFVSFLEAEKTYAPLVTKAKEDYANWSIDPILRKKAAEHLAKTRVDFVVARIEEFAKRQGIENFSALCEEKDRLKKEVQP